MAQHAGIPSPSEAPPSLLASFGLRLPTASFRFMPCRCSRHVGELRVPNEEVGELRQPTKWYAVRAPHTLHCAGRRSMLKLAAALCMLFFTLYYFTATGRPAAACTDLPTCMLAVARNVVQDYDLSLIHI